jgi:hypothetical protein
MPLSESKISIIICTEKGALEGMSKLLVSSLRKYGGILKDVPICSYQPRKDFPVSKETIKFFEKNNVHFIDLDLNKQFKTFGFANKPIVCSHAENNLKSEILVFLDSDILFLNEPADFLLNSEHDIILKPVGNKNIGAENEADPNYTYWQKIYEYLNVENINYVNSFVDNKRMLAYWNSGHIVTKREKGVFNAWEQNFINTINEQIFAPNFYFTEQFVLSATVSAMNLRVKEFQKQYNYPVRLLEKKFISHKNHLDIKELISIHYHSLFTNTIISNIVLKSLKNGEKGMWLREQLAEHNILPSLFNRSKNLYRKIKNSLK